MVEKKNTMVSSESSRSSKSVRSDARVASELNTRSPPDRPSRVVAVVACTHESEHTKLMTSWIINLPLVVFYRQSISSEVVDKSKDDLNSSNSNYFPLCPPRSIKSRDYFSKFPHGNKILFACPMNCILLQANF